MTADIAEIAGDDIVDDRRGRRQPLRRVHGGGLLLRVIFGLAAGMGQAGGGKFG